ncbi:integrase core domain-containing protein [Pseudoalteromonas luteoviolacea]|uniref:integrase core domain-containing protein n=1 Tax=Pseudoalteromonas luteoviolacea TaxID=43657 RepID=UPI00114E4C90|nr:integrase core domain-containing protein [Pseudoalteromonas luteoviolacea]TQF66181.1 transposase [Pseudoalteromonas luteoviolacea]
MRKGKRTETQIVYMIKAAVETNLLDLYLFESLQQIRDITDEWLDIYNYEWSHGALGAQTLMAYLGSA